MRSGWVLSLTLALAGCAVGPVYERPVVDMGGEYAAALPAHPDWVRIDAAPPVAPLDASWWRLFGDSTLDVLMTDMLAANADLAQAEARYRQARATLDATRAGLFPTVGSSASGSRSGSGSGQPSNQYSLGASASWEIDLWGRLRGGVRAGEASLQASEADLAGARLSLQSTLVQTYVRLRMAQAQEALLARTVEGYERLQRAAEQRQQAGMVARADVVAATAQLENGRVQLLAQERQRQQLQHALAVLVGRAPSAFQLAGGALPTAVPAVPAGVPAQLLLQRPDVHAAERRVAEANARIGVAQTAWLPNLTLSAQGGFRSGEWAQWLTAPASFWSLGPALALQLFDGGARRARVEEARAAHEAQSAAYRGTVLVALREVEDALVQMDGLAREQIVQARALAAAEETVRLTRHQYDAGMVDFLSVVQVENSALAAARSALSLQGDRLLASMQLITALGGGWQVPDASGVPLAEPAL